MKLGSSASQGATITNTGDETIAISVTGSADFSVTGSCDGTTVAVSATCVEEVDYDPSALSSATGTLKVVFTSIADSTTTEVDVPLTRYRVLAGPARAVDDPDARVLLSARARRLPRLGDL